MLIIDRNESMCMEEKIGWMDPIKIYVETGVLPGDKVEPDRIRK